MKIDDCFGKGGEAAAAELCNQMLKLGDDDYISHVILCTHVSTIAYGLLS